MSSVHLLISTAFPAGHTIFYTMSIKSSGVPVVAMWISKCMSLSLKSVDIAFRWSWLRQTTQSMFHRGVKQTHTQTHRMAPAFYCPLLIRGGLTLPSLSPKNKGLAADVRELYQCSISPAAPGQPGRREERPRRCRMAAGKEKDTADKRINYFINFISQLTLHATFQVSQPGEDERCRAPVLATPHQPEKNSESEKRWGEERWRIL